MISSLRCSIQRSLQQQPRTLLTTNATKVLVSSTTSSSSSFTPNVLSSSKSLSMSTTTTATNGTTTTTSTTTSSNPKLNRVQPHAMIAIGEKVISPPLVYITGEEMTHYATQLFIKEWFLPYFDISKWKQYDLSCKNRDITNDQVLQDAIIAGKKIGAIFKEPTITPTVIQQKEMNLTKPLGSPNGAMRKGWNGITISRDTIHIDGIDLGFKNRVLFERHAVGGEYGAGYSKVGEGTLLTTYIPNDDNERPFVVDKRDLTDEHNVVVVYHNPYDNVDTLAHFFYKRCLEHNVTPYIVTKKTVFKWQEGFWQVMKSIFDKHYHEQFLEAGLLERSNGELQHLISDAATMQLIRWTDGGFGMAAHNYDGDMLTDQIAQIHRSPGFITSNLVGKNDDGTLIKEFEASHGTVSDLWHAHLDGKETSLNPLGLVEAMMGALEHAAALDAEANVNNNTKQTIKDQIFNYTTTLRMAIHNTFRYGQGTRDMSGPNGLTTEDFIAKVAWRLQRYLAMQFDDEPPPPVLLQEPSRKFRRNHDVVDMDAIQKLFNKYDINGDGHIDVEEFTDMMIKLNMAPVKKNKKSDEKTPDV